MAAIVGPILIIGGLISLFSQLIPPLQEAISQELFPVNPNRIPNLAEAINLRYFDTISETEFINYCKRNGFDQEVSNIFFKSSENILSEMDLISAWRRNIISEDELTYELTKRRYSTDNINRLKNVSQFYPSAPDLIHFAVRDVYDPTIVQQYGQKQDIPTQFLTEAQKAGIEKEQAENYWAAHWILPSITQGFEMMHRNVISRTELSRLLKSLDIMPFWRDKLTEISYNPLTRVDVRRMYKLGVLDESEVKKSYLNIGYNENDAEKMTAFTKKYEGDTEKELTKSAIDKAFKNDIISTEEYKTYLLDIGYTDDNINFWLAIINYEKEESTIDLLITDAIARYRLGELTLPDVRNTLAALDLPATYIENVINKELTQVAKKIKVPSKSDIDNWLKLNVITDREYYIYLKKIGYTEDDTVHFLEEIAIEIDISKRKYLPIKTYQRWLSTQILSTNKFIEIATDLKYAQRDIEKLIEETRTKTQ